MQGLDDCTSYSMSGCCNMTTAGDNHRGKCFGAVHWDLQPTKQAAAQARQSYATTWTRSTSSCVQPGTFSKLSRSPALQRSPAITSDIDQPFGTRCSMTPADSVCYLGIATGFLCASIPSALLPTLQLLLQLGWQTQIRCQWLYCLLQPLLYFLSCIIQLTHI